MYFKNLLQIKKKKDLICFIKKIKHLHCTRHNLVFGVFWGFLFVFFGGGLLLGFFFALHLLTYRKYSQFKESLQHFRIELLGKKLKLYLKIVCINKVLSSLSFKNHVAGLNPPNNQNIDLH